MKFSREFCYNFIDVDLFLSSYHILQYLKFITSHFYSSKLSSFKIGGPILQNSENMGTKTAIKPKIY